MGKKSFETIISSLQKEGYSSKILEVKMDGPYTSKDSDWNYKDVPHPADDQIRVREKFLSFSFQSPYRLRPPRLADVCYPLSID